MSKDFTTTPNVALGLRNNNPGNLRSTSVKWQGQIGVDSKGFVIFRDVSYGIRAFGIDITSKIKRGLNTINKIITVYAPPSENNTQAYIDKVVQYTGIGAFTPLTATKQTLETLARGFFNVELGTSAKLLTNSDISEGVNLISGIGGIAAIAGDPNLIIIFLVAIAATILILKS